MPTQASPFVSPESLDRVNSHDEVGNAYVHVLHWASMIRQAVTDTGTSRPANVTAGAETVAFDAAKTTLLTSLDSVVDEARTITDLLPTA
jgi:hypothetical protein